MSCDRHEWFLNQIFPHRVTLQRYLRRLGVANEDVEDLIQEVYLRIYGVSDYAGVESPQALLLTIARNLAVERARKRQRQATDSVSDFEPLEVAALGPAVDERLDARRRFESFCAAVDTLPPVCRRAFVLRKVYKLSHDEIADVLGISHSTIEKHVVKGLRRCRDYLRERGMLEEGATAAAAPSSRTARQAEMP